MRLGGVQPLRNSIMRGLVRRVPPPLRVLSMTRVCALR